MKIRTVADSCKIKSQQKYLTLKSVNLAMPRRTKIDIENFQFLDVMLAGLERLGCFFNFYLFYVGSTVSTIEICF
jgi:hypothetical protein